MRSLSILAGAILLAGISVSARPASSARSTPPRATASASTTIQVQGLSGNIDHGRYIVHDIAMCFECHSPRDAQGNIIESQEFDGGPIPVRPPWGDWALIAPRNKGLPGYDDAQAMRLLTEGAIGRDGRQLRPPMPRFHMNKQDAADVIAYMRSLK